METMMEHLAFTIGMDPLDFRLNNLLDDGDNLLSGKPFEGPNLVPEIVQDLKTAADYDNRKIAVATFNSVFL